MKQIERYEKMKRSLKNACKVKYIAKKFCKRLNPPTLVISSVMNGSVLGNVYEHGVRDPYQFLFGYLLLGGITLPAPLYLIGRAIYAIADTRAKYLRRKLNNQLQKTE